MTVKWDLRFLRQAEEISTWSKDPSTKVGCVIVDHDTKCQLSGGFNGFPRGMEDIDERLSNREIKYKLVCHAEANAIAAAARHGHMVRGAILYATAHPCSSCAVLIAQAGISRVVFQTSTGYETRWKEDVDAARLVFGELRIECVRYSPMETGSIDKLSHEVLESVRRAK